MKRLHTMTRSSTRSGREHLELHALVGPLGWYRRTSDQNWSPSATERTVEVGLQLGRWRMGLSSVSVLWLEDGRVRTRERRRLW